MQPSFEMERNRGLRHAPARIGERRLSTGGWLTKYNEVHLLKGFEVSILSLRTFLRFFAHVQLLPILESGEETLVGGQAVMEGVMMRAPHSYCVAVRKPDGEIVTEQNPLPRMSEKYPIFKLPILRGLGTLGHAMTL